MTAIVGMICFPTCLHGDLSRRIVDAPAPSIGLFPLSYDHHSSTASPVDMST